MWFNFLNNALFFENMYKVFIFKTFHISIISILYITNIYIYIYECVCVYVYVYVCMCVCVWVCVCVYIYIYIYIFAWDKNNIISDAN